MSAIDIATTPLGGPTLAQERLINPFLRTREDTVIRAAQAFDATASGDTGVFAAIRQWKNEFK